MIRRFVWVCLAIALAGCEAGGAGNALGLCSTVCRCFPGLPSQQQACVDECVSDDDIVDVTSACERCVFQNDSTCSNLFEACFDGGPCDPEPQPPFPPEPVPDPVPMPASARSGVDVSQEEDL